MNNSRLEYLPSPGENGNGHSNGNSNGHGEHHEKVFPLTKAVDPDMLAILAARRECRAETRERLDRAKYMFEEIADRAQNSRGPGFSRKGSVAIPDSELARKLGVCSNSIRTWKRQLEACGYIWTSFQHRSNSWPMTVYHLTCLHLKPQKNTQHPDGSSNAGPGRSAPTERCGALRQGSKLVKLEHPVTSPLVLEEPKKVKSPAIAAQIANLFRLTSGRGSAGQADRNRDLMKL